MTIRQDATKRRESFLTAEEKPKPFKINYDGIPDALTERDQWILWRWKPSQKGAHRWTKAPHQPNGRLAATDNREHWSTYDDVRTAMDDGNFSGIGFVITPPFIGLDLDGVLIMEDRQFDEEAMRIITRAGTYAEISPTGTGVKMIGTGEIPDNLAKSEILDTKTKGYFTITGKALSGFPDVNPINFSRLRENTPGVQRALAMMEHVERNDASDGSSRLMQYARRAAMADLTDVEALDAIGQMTARYPMPSTFDEEQILKRVTDARERHELDRAKRSRDRAEQKKARDNEDRKTRVEPANFSLSQLANEYPTRAPELIEGVLRRRETMNLIGATKLGKSWLSYSLALSLATGQSWLGHDVQQSRVLMIDNELHCEELSWRIREVCHSMRIDPAELDSCLTIEPTRGRGWDINDLTYLVNEHHSTVDVVIIDALYRTLPEGISENDNSQMTLIYNTIDAMARQSDTAVCLVHHSSKGDQSSKNLVDVGSGAGSITRATDTHVVLRSHKLKGMAVMESAVRSNIQAEPMTVEFNWPLWIAREDVEPELQSTKIGQAKKDEDFQKEILDVLRDNGESSIRYIRNKTKAGKSRVERHLDLLQLAGEIVHTIHTDNTETYDIDYGDLING